MSFEELAKDREPAQARVALFHEFELLALKMNDEPTSREERERYEELSKEISEALYWMQRRLTQADKWLEYEEGRMFSNRDQATIDQLRNIRDALPWNQSRWSGEKN